jgi:hypothetical protein
VESDKHVNIIWENRTVDGFLKFFEDIDRFVLTYNQPIPYLFTHISENRKDIRAKMMSSRLQLKTYEMAQLYFAPRDLAHFISLLTGATRLKLYGLRQKFKERFEFQRSITSKVASSTFGRTSHPKVQETPSNRC